MGEKGERKLPPPPNTVGHYTITPDDITKLLRADVCHRAGITGEGVNVGIVDSGWYDHEYFTIARREFQQRHAEQGWQGSGRGWAAPRIVMTTAISPMRALPNPEDDVSESSHGTGMVANLYSVAPGVSLRLYSKDGQSFMQALEAAVEQCQVISISKAQATNGWPGNMLQRYRDVFANAKRNGKVVLHANGNSGSLPWPIANVPKDMVKVGGVHRRANGTREAADYAMAHGGDQLPDVCGLCGMMPAGAYIWLPGDPDRDGPNAYARGWGLHSGTSSATPQAAGVVALMIQAPARLGMPALNLATAKSILRRSATPVFNGASAVGIAASPNWTLLVDAARAVEMAVQ